MRVGTFCFIIVSWLLVLDVMAIGSGLNSFLEFYEDFALATMWKNMIYYTWYKYLGSFVCDSYSTYLFGFLQSTLGVTEDTVKATIDGPTLCMKGFDLMYRTVWYTKGAKVFYFGSESSLAYTPTG